jgi:tetratricopeptide (TPR) repeat protein
MTRSWTGMVDRIGQWIPLPLLVLIMLAIAGIAGALWYFYPRWIPRRLPRFRKPRWNWKGFFGAGRWRFKWRWPDWRAWFKRRKRTEEQDLEAAIAELEQSEEELPEAPMAAFLTLADRYAAEGRYAEAIRERLRAIVRDLVNRGVILHRPGWTVTELAIAATAVRPTVDRPLTEAAMIFSEIWYGQRPATAAHDARMRVLTTEVDQALLVPPGIGVPSGVPA